VEFHLLIGEGGCGTITNYKIIIILLFQMLATSFSHYLWKLKNGGAYIITRQYHGIPLKIIIAVYNLYQL
jgi:hypothetical protein